MIDNKMTFCSKQAINASHTTKHLDLGQEHPDLGMANCPKLGITVFMTTPFTGGSSPKITFEIQQADESAPGSNTPGSFATLISTGAIPADATFPTAFEIPLPLTHKRFIKVVATASGSPTAGSATIAVTDGTQHNPRLIREI